MKKIALIIIGCVALFVVCVISMSMMWNAVPSPKMVSPEGIAVRSQFPSIVFACFPLLFVGLCLYSLVHVLRNRDLRDGERTMWLLVVVLLNLVGAILYFLIAPDPATIRADNQSRGLA